MNNTIWACKIDLDNNAPLYQQLEEIILMQIKSGVLRQGELLPSEAEFCKHYNISRSTIRQALSMLEKSGYIFRRRGMGTFVAEPKICRNICNLYSFTRQMEELGYSSHSLVTEFSKTYATQELVNIMDIKEGQGVFDFTRIRIADEIPLLIERSIVPEYICPDLTKSILETGSLYEILQNKYNVDIFEATETYEPVIVGKKEAGLLKCPEKSPAFRIQRLSYTKEGDIFEYTVSTMGGQHSKLEINLFKEGISVKK